MMIRNCVTTAFLASAVLAESYFVEKFDDSWTDRWVMSTKKGSEQGEWALSAGKWYQDAEKDKGIQTTQNGKFYGTSAKLEKPFSNKGKDLVIQYQVKHEQNIDCGGGYIKLHKAGEDQENLHGDSPYNIMFGPDICGASSKRVHVIFNYNGKNLLRKDNIPAKTDDLSHLYTLILKPDNTYAVHIDGKEEAKGKLEDDFDFLEPKQIDDPEDKKPSQEDWDEREEIVDPDDVKPEGYDDIPEFIVDDSEGQPEDWDAEEDGEWEAPTIPNPEYKGPWRQKTMKNPDYKGKWSPKKIDNPDYKEDDKLYLYEDNGVVSFDLWQVKSGSIFDNVWIGDSLEEAQAFAKETFDGLQDAEKKMKEEVEAKEREAEEAEKENAADDDDKDDDDNSDGDDDDDDDDDADDDKKKDEL